MEIKFGKDYDDFLSNETKKNICKIKKGNCYLGPIPESLLP